MRTHPVLVINPRSGGDSPSADELVAAVEKLGVEPHVLAEGEDPGEVARASGAGILGMAGGDGSLAAVAQVALDTDAAFVCIPFGTRNHFARDLGLDRNDPLAALEAFSGGIERRIDVGRVADRLFLNNVSLGAYAGLVHEREHHRRRGEMLARARALLKVVRHRHGLHARVNGKRLRARVILIGNNRYDVELFTIGERARLDEGVLQLWAADGWVPSAWEEQVSDRFRLEVRGGRVRTAIDGEPVVLDSPLELESLPQALRVLLPANPAE